MDNIVGKYEIVDINKLNPNTWNPKDNVEDSKENEEMYQELLDTIDLKGFNDPIDVRVLDNSTLEIIDGKHRWLAAKELGYSKIPIINFGKISKEEAEGITLDKIHIRIEANQVKVAQIIKEMFETYKGDMAQMTQNLPFDETKIQEYLEMANFDWDKFKKENDEEEHKEKLYVTVEVTQEQKDQIESTIELAKGDKEITDAEALVMICKKFTSK